jgi:Flp pilus assembly pilin Flp
VNERGLVALEWMLLAILVVVVLVGVFSPALQSLLTNVVNAIAASLTAAP